MIFFRCSEEKAAQSWQQRSTFWKRLQNRKWKEGYLSIDEGKLDVLKRVSK